MEIVPIALILVPVAALVFAFGRWAEAQKRSFEEALVRVGDARGLRLSPSTWSRRAYTRGVTEGIDVVLDSYVVSTGKSSQTYTRVRSRHRALPLTLRIGPEGMFAAMGKAIGVQADTAVGDPGFDDAVVIRGEPEASIVARLSGSARRAIVAAVAAGAKHEDGVWTLATNGLVAEDHRLEEMLRLVVAASRALVDSDSSDASLLARAEADRSPGVRRRALELAVRGGVPDDRLARLADDDDAEVALIAARARGEAGRERLWALLDRREVARDAATALAALAEDARRGELEEVLLWHLEDRPDADVIAALGRIASVRAVAPLRALEGPLGVGATTAAARDAVRAIQARAHGEAGGLAVAEVAGGELAEAHRSRLGRLSQARARE